jgi:hypothetical protein
MPRAAFADVAVTALVVIADEQSFLLEDAGGKRGRGAEVMVYSPPRVFKLGGAGNGERNKGTTREFRKLVADGD